MSEADPLLSQKNVYDRFTASQKRLILIMAVSSGIIGRSIGVYFSKTVSLLFVSRALQALGASSLLSLGAAMLSDVYRVEERGTAIGIYFGSLQYLEDSSQLSHRGV
ncbi:hypothetical protein Clacol_009498 [Clathrus columnatus]|uniref:Major facilitator superfamily (MFS) profile domain-containing protein n=1 Tax=Clathrus columnatus TaxID=1419009 RepID=A0AAV5AN95_9AGAM|nr:hypothetical protein Clacol_009498 [Clathrus columnatus]